MDIFNLLKVEKIDLYSFNRETGKYEYVTTLDEIDCITDDELNNLCHNGETYAIKRKESGKTFIFNWEGK